MLRILLINDTAKKVGRLKAALTEAGFEVIDESGLTIDLPARVETVRPDVILIDTESPSNRGSMQSSGASRYSGALNSCAVLRRFSWLASMNRLASRIAITNARAVLGYCSTKARVQPRTFSG